MSTPTGDNFEENFRANLLAWREGGKLTPADAARALDLSAQTYGRYEKGERFPDSIALLQISRKLGVTMEALLSNQLVIKQNHGSDLEAAIRDIARDEMARVFKTAQGLAVSRSLVEVAALVVPGSPQPQRESVLRLLQESVPLESIAHRPKSKDDQKLEGET